MITYARDGLIEQVWRKVLGDIVYIPLFPSDPGLGAARRSRSADLHRGGRPRSSATLAIRRRRRPVPASNGEQATGFSGIRKVGFGSGNQARGTATAANWNTT